MWTDKSKFNLVKSDGAQKVWRKEGKAFKLSCIRGTVKFGNVMVWGSMTWNGTGKLEFIDGIIGSKNFVNILNKNLLPSTQKQQMGKDFIFLQDTDPKYTSYKAKEFSHKRRLNYLNDRLKVQISIQLNICELFWIKKLAHDTSKRKKS